MLQHVHGGTSGLNSPIEHLNVIGRMHQNGVAPFRNLYDRHVHERSSAIVLSTDVVLDAFRFRLGLTLKDGTAEVHIVLSDRLGIPRLGCALLFHDGSTAFVLFLQRFDLLGCGLLPCIVSLGIRFGGAVRVDDGLSLGLDDLMVTLLLLVFLLTVVGLFLLVLGLVLFLILFGLVLLLVLGRLFFLVLLGFVLGLVLFLLFNLGLYFDRGCDFLLFLNLFLIGNRRRGGCSFLFRSDLSHIGKNRRGNILLVLVLGCKTGFQTHQTGIESFHEVG